MKKEVLLLLVIIIIGYSLSAVTWIVDQSGNGDAVTIQAGIDLSSAGDTVLVYEGTYTGEITINNKVITLASLYIADGDTTHIANTIIDGEDTRTGIKVLNCRQGDLWTQIIGFTIRNGRSDWTEYDTRSIGGGIAVYTSNLQVSDCIIYHNRAYQGGGIGTHSSLVNLIHNTIYRNTSIKSGGGISAVFGTDNLIVFDETRRNSVYLNHSAMGSDIVISMPCLSAPVYLDKGTVPGADPFFFMPPSQFTLDILQTAVTQVQQDIWVSPMGSDSNSGLNSASPLQTITYAVAKANPDSLHPVTVHLLPGTYSWSGSKQPFPIQVKSYLTIEGSSRESVILDAENFGSFFEGYLYWDNYHIKNLTCINGNTLLSGIHFNSQQDNIGGDEISLQNISIKDSWSLNDMVRLSSFKHVEVSWLIVSNCQDFSGLTIDAFEYARVENSIVINNSPTYYDWPYSYSLGIGLVAYEQYPQLAKVEVINCLIANNRNDCTFWGPVTSGLAIDVSNGNCDVDVINCTIAGNIALEPHTPGFVAGGVNYRVDVFNTLISGNAPFEAGMITTLQADSAVVAFNHSLVTGGESSFWYMNGIGTCLWQEGNIYTIPVYDSTSQYVYYPGLGSPTIDSGTSNLPADVVMPLNDLAGNPRIYNGHIDIGCYEYGSTAYQDNTIPDLDLNHLNIYPNPFLNNTNISYKLEKASDVSLEVFNTKGQRVKKLVNAKQTKGEQVIHWDGKDETGKACSSGIFVIKLIQDNIKIITKKVTLIK